MLRGKIQVVFFYQKNANLRNQYDQFHSTFLIVLLQNYLLFLKDLIYLYFKSKSDLTFISHNLDMKNLHFNLIN
jgi:hypothetical protein